MTDSLTLDLTALMWVVMKDDGMVAVLAVLMDVYSVDLSVAALVAMKVVYLVV